MYKPSLASISFPTCCAAATLVAERESGVTGADLFLAMGGTRWQLEWRLMRADGSTGTPPGPTAPPAPAAAPPAAAPAPKGERVAAVRPYGEADDGVVPELDSARSSILRSGGFGTCCCCCCCCCCKAAACSFGKLSLSLGLSTSTSSPKSCADSLLRRGLPSPPGERGTLICFCCCSWCCCNCCWCSLACCCCCWME